MEHSFDIELAKKYGVKEAILIRHFQFWITKNKANGVNYYDGRTWTYNSIKAFQEIFPYLTERQIRYALDNLVKKGVLIKGNYNKSKYDHTLWYAFKDESIFLKSNFDFTILSNRNQKNVKSENAVAFSLVDYTVGKILKNFPELKFSSHDKKKFAEMFDKLTRIDKRSEEEIREVVDWVTSQTEKRNGFCWAEQFRSPLKLRKKNKEGVKYFDLWLSLLKKEKENKIDWNFEISEPSEEDSENETVWEKNMKKLGLL